MTRVRSCAARILSGGCLAVGLAACGSSSPAALSASTALTLHRAVARIRSAADAGRVPQARAAVTAFEAQVSALVNHGAVASQDAKVLILDARQAARRLPAVPASSATDAAVTATTATSTATTPATTATATPTAAPAPTPATTVAPPASPTPAPAPTPGAPGPAHGPARHPGHPGHPGKGRGPGQAKGHGK